ncbi:hypothetical protein [Bacillus cereus]|uniref:Uncharacterized protein n=1 Tax=Bacillus cereus TaxID=1396 RepID=A0A2A7HXP7_BACCE|nr:hypothetical protein [Bacillus cereus]PEC21644.1 hypothetical protein COM96_13960 [Bacillus cereus]
MKKIKQCIHPFPNSTMFQKSVAPIGFTLFLIFLLLYGKRILYEKKAETAHSRFCFFYYILK